MEIFLLKNFHYIQNVAMNFLIDEERYLLRIQHKKERDKRICDRIKAVLLHDKGWSFQQIAEAYCFQAKLFAIILQNTKQRIVLDPNCIC